VVQLCPLYIFAVLDRVRGPGSALPRNDKVKEVPACLRPVLVGNRLLLPYFRNVWTSEEDCYPFLFQAALKPNLASTEWINDETYSGAPLLGSGLAIGDALLDEYGRRTSRPVW